MGSTFEFASAASVRFGWGSLGQFHHHLAGLGEKVLVVCGKHSKRVEPCLEVLQSHGKRATLFQIPHEPDTQLIEEGLTCMAEGMDWVLGMGGGSVLDAAKALAIMAPQPGSLMDYLEVIGHGFAFPASSLPVVAIPTTAGTGSEVTRNAVLVSREHRVKVSLRHASMLPEVALVDPALTCTLPASMTAATGLDALTQLIEPFLSSRANPITDGLARQGIPLILRSLETAVRCPDHRQARTDMAMGSLLGGMALANAGLGAVHGIAGPLGGMQPSAPHGAICAVLLPHSLKQLHGALLEQPSSSACLDKLQSLACMILGHRQASIAEALGWLHEWIDSFTLPPLRAHGLLRNECALLAEKALASSSMDGHPIKMTLQEVNELVLCAY